jgi:hypothetical protein
MPLRSLRRSALFLALPLLAASCASAPDPGSPVPAQLSDRQANLMARQYLTTHNVSAPRVLVSEQKQPRGWWLRYEGPFDPQARPPQASYLVEVDNDGTVRDID